MSRVVRAVRAGQQRRDLLRVIAAAIRAVAMAESAERRDLLAFIVLALGRLLESVEATAEAWERRGYWVKADRFRLEWKWVVTLLNEMTECLGRHDWAGAVAALGSASDRLRGFQVGADELAARPWSGAWEAWQARNLHRGVR